MYRIFNTNVLGMILVVLSWAVIAMMVYLFLRVIAARSGSIYLDLACRSCGLRRLSGREAIATAATAKTKCRLDL